jgi:catechol 2,3-dioxygenase-like lactoylglutathione lyase family enzyme
MDIKMGAIVLDSANADALADFYSKLLGWEKQRYDSEWVIVASKGGEGTPLVFQQIENYQRPSWPAQAEKQQQMLHLDFYVSNVEEGVQHAIACGAVPAETQLADDWRVLLDPAGHPFCILPNTPPDKN